MVPDRSMLLELDPANGQFQITNGKYIVSNEFGTIVGRQKNRQVSLILKDVLVVPKLASPLLSLSSLSP
jgi:hypothetical protein